MKTRLTLKPGQKGTKKLLDCYGDRLVCVRYKYDAKTRKRYKTVELVVDAANWEPPRNSETHIQIKWGEADLRKQVKQSGANWDKEKKVWVLTYGQVKSLKLEHRIVDVMDYPYQPESKSEPAGKSPHRK